MLYFIVWVVFIVAIIAAFLVAMAIEKKNQPGGVAMDDPAAAPDFADEGFDDSAEAEAVPVAAGDDFGGDFGGENFSDDADFEGFN